MLSNRRKKELLGALSVALSVLIALAIVSYAPPDNAAVTALLEAGHPAHGTGVQNWLGLPGAAIAWALVPRFMGYPALIWCGLAAAFGWRLLRHRPLGTLTRPALQALGGAVLACIFFGWIGHAFEASMEAWAGSLGLGIAGVAVQGLGAAGAFLVGTALAGAFGLYLREGSVRAAATRAAAQARNAATTVRTVGPPYAQRALRWLRARYTDTNVDPMAPRPVRSDEEHHGSEEDEHKDEQQSEQDTEDTASPSIKDPTAPDASGFRLVRKDEETIQEEEEASTSSSSTSAPQHASPSTQPEDASSRPHTSPARPSVPDAHAAPHASPSENESASTNDPDDPVSNFDEVRARVQRIHERMQRRNPHARDDASPDDTPPDASSPARSDASDDDDLDARANPVPPDAAPDTPETPPASETTPLSHPPASADALFEDAAYLVVRYQDGSTSFVRRMLAIGPERAERIVQQLAQAGVVGPHPDTGERVVRVSESHVLDAWFASG